MKRLLFACWIALAPAALLLTATGCEQEVRTVERKQTVHESEPQMVSPGTEKVE